MSVVLDYNFDKGVIYLNTEMVKIDYTKSLFNRLFNKTTLIKTQDIENIIYIKTVQQTILTIYFNNKTETLYFKKKPKIFMKFIDQLLKYNHNIKVIEKLASNPSESDTCCYYKNE